MVVMTASAQPDSPAVAIKAAGHRLIGEKGSGFTTQDLIKEAGVALQTFYRYFGSKDQLVIELIADLTLARCIEYSAVVDGMTDPVARLTYIVRTTLAPLKSDAEIAGAQFVGAERWRLHQLYPAEVWAATQPFTDLIRRELEAGLAQGVLAPRNPERDAWLITKTVVSTFHHYAYEPDDPAMTTIADDVTDFCLAAVGAVVKRYSSDLTSMSKKS